MVVVLVFVADCRALLLFVRLVVFVADCRTLLLFVRLGDAGAVWLGRGCTVMLHGTKNANALREAGYIPKRLHATLLFGGKRTPHVFAEARRKSWSIPSHEGMVSTAARARCNDGQRRWRRTASGA